MTGRPERRFALRLALALGHHNVDAMLEGMTFEQFAEWREFYKVEPFGFPVEDAFNARQTWATFKASASKDWTGKPADFLVGEEAEEAEVDVDPVAWLHERVGGEIPPRPEGPPVVIEYFT